MPSAISPAVDLVAFEEGFVNRVYLCPAGYPTLGFGRRVVVTDYETGEPITFPVRREKELETLRLKLNARANWLEAKYKWFTQLSPQRQAVLVSLAYQVGNDGFTRFKRMILCLENFDFKGATIEYLDSDAARQCRLRFARGADILRNNTSITSILEDN
jgi:lysozyme